jgi:hypothetical protein
MWVNRALFDMIVEDNKSQQVDIRDSRIAEASIAGSYTKCLEQKAKDDLTIDWMRHRINALERANSILMNKVSGVSMPVPEIVASRPGTMSELPNQMTHMPSFEDVGDGEATRLGVFHNAEGELEYQDGKQ